MPHPLNDRILRMQKFGFWVRTKLSPHRAVKWEPETTEDGRQTQRGQRWVEVLAHGERRIPKRFYAAEVEAVGPHEWLSYYPAVDEPVCGYMEAEGRYCPRARAITSDAIQPWCPKHEAELSAPPGEESDDSEQPAG